MYELPSHFSRHSSEYVTPKECDTWKTVTELLLENVYLSYPDTCVQRMVNDHVSERTVQ